MAELRDVMAELKEVNTRAKLLRKRHKELEEQIMEYIEENELPGIKFDTLIVRKAETVRHAPKSKKDKEDSIVETLEQLGISDAKKACESILRAMQGEALKVTKARINITVPELL